MNGDALRRVMTVARREFLTTIRRRAFLFTVLGTPAYFAVVMLVTSAAEVRERREVLRELSAVGVVDSSGLFAQATREIRTQLRAENPFAQARGSRGLPDPRSLSGGGQAGTIEEFRASVRFYPGMAEAEAALRAREVDQVIVVPESYLEAGGVRRYARSSSLFSGTDGRAIGAWLARNLVRGRVDSALAARVARPVEGERLYNLGRGGAFELKDDRRQLVDIMLPLVFALLLGMCITIGGQYLLQGVAEEKESRILESLLCAISPGELMTGKLFGLGGAGLLLVGLWSAIGALTAGPMLATLGTSLPPWILLLAVAYFVLGYLFYGSMMIGIGAVTNNMREGQQFSVWITLGSFVPMIVFTSIVSRPNSALAVGLSLFPLTAPTSMVMRLSAPGAVVPAWQIGLSLLLLAAAMSLALIGSARVFRIGLLLYGKTPNLPEILRWARRGA